MRIHAPQDGEVATLYEMGIPVVETGDKYHVDIQQKVPLNMDQDNVTPAYLQKMLEDEAQVSPESGRPSGNRRRTKMNPADIDPRLREFFD